MGQHKRALLVIDMLNDFLLPGAPLEVPAGREVIPNIAREIAAARAQGAAVVYVCDRHAPNDPEFAQWPAHCVAGTPGTDVVKELAPQPGDVAVPKTTYSGFYGTDLEARLKELGVQSLTVTGILTDICVYWTAGEAALRGWRPEVVRDCVAAASEEDHATALRQVERLFGVKIR
jgi:nicotinamidase-related amidase